MSTTTTSTHDARSPRWLGPRQMYQRAAMTAYLYERDGETLLPWSWVSTDCDLEHCLTVECMTIHTPTVIDYPERVCVYCGDPAGTKDHLVGRAWSGGAQRRHVAVVPACGDCNNRINDRWAPSVVERRAIAQASLRKKYRKLLAEREWDETDMAELGHSLREHVIKGQHKREYVKARLAWPTDPDYDLRAFQRSGIENPAELGLI